MSEVPLQCHGRRSPSHSLARTCRIEATAVGHYRGTSLVRKRRLLEPYRLCLGLYGGPRRGQRFLMSEVPLQTSLLHARLLYHFLWKQVQFESYFALARVVFILRILVYLVVHASGKVSLEHLLLAWYPYQP